MDDETIGSFMTITSATPQQAQSYLQIADGNLEQAIQLFFDSPGLDVAGAQPTTAPTAPAPPAPSHPSAPYTEDDDGIIHIDSDDETPEAGTPQPQQPAPTQQTYQPDAMFEDDEALARRLQEEMYAGGDMSAGVDAEGVRAPLARTRETLVGPDAEYGGEDGIQASIAQQLMERERRRAAGRPGIFNQRESQPTIWEDNDPVTSQRELARATGGASDASSKSSHLANLFRPPFELLTNLSWEEAREEGKDQEKWLLVNIQEPSVFDCQVLNRDIWKDKGIVEAVRENFIFLQYTNNDPRAMPYVQYYFHTHESPDAYPHIAIVDPRTGEQVKVWSGPPGPKPADFLTDLHEFLDRYSLNVHARNPVATRKPAPRRETQVERMTEDEMLEMAVRNSLAADHGSASRALDPDALTKSDGSTPSSDDSALRIDKGKARASTPSTPAEANGLAPFAPDARQPSPSPAPPSLFSTIRSDAPHTEPAADPATTTRIQFRHPSGRVIRRFGLEEPVGRIYEWLKAEPEAIGGRDGEGRAREFELVSMGRNLMGEGRVGLEGSVREAGLMNGTVMVEFVG
ncbi:hypothetical protein P152DRAFT_389788 [Eremomyces bilateralis CBS 781.70]|uniref:UAS domain-containing protein n=1 Tax=Eremomyces bilateralis CBS 781.70 TaxID=1392243 RepID=A0A6G1GC10_9PEZI|nr:uncharacterized protein P152DRAFT_389788 [Eremomyces bilateralis CBS 781.70]KAF1815564.1 hypothetical protein P152DRAFT_389788 [Eremomyces bilateralis CBS 781.70]